MKRKLTDGIVIAGLLASLVFNYYLYARARTAEGINAKAADDITRYTKQLQQYYDQRLDSVYQAHGIKRAELKQQRNKTTNNASKTRQNIRQADSLSRSIPVSKLDSAWSNTIDKMP